MLPVRVGDDKRAAKAAQESILRCNALLQRGGASRQERVDCRSAVRGRSKGTAAAPPLATASMPSIGLRLGG
jgi:hypothetical protein